MPTYQWRCLDCGERLSIFQSIRSYVQDAPVYVHCGHRMERVLAPVALTNTNDRIYEGLRAPDGTDISTRTKHRAYMKERNLTTMDDFKDTWKKAALERKDTFEGVDPSRRSDIAEAITKLEQGYAPRIQPADE